MSWNDYPPFAVSRHACCCRAGGNGVRIINDLNNESKVRWTSEERDPRTGVYKMVGIERVLGPGGWKEVLFESDSRNQAVEVMDRDGKWTRCKVGWNQDTYQVSLILVGCP